MTAQPRRAMPIFSAALLVASAVTLALNSAPAQAGGDPEIGDELASHWCSNCHAVAGQARASDAAPPLATIAQKHAEDQHWLRAWLADPHPPMPNLNLSRAEIDDVIAYLQRLATAQ